MPAHAALPARWAMLPFLRWLAVVLACNGIAAALVLVRVRSVASVPTYFVTAATINVGLAVLVRQQYFVNVLFRAATSVPLRWPLRVRAALAQVYQFSGGVHVGCAVAAIGWFTAFTALTAGGVVTGPRSGLGIALLALSAAILAVLGGMAVCARPTAREQRHDRYELTHRYGGWLSVVLFAVLTVLTVLITARSGDSVVAALAASPGTWIVLAVAVFVGTPWLQLRHIPVSVVTPSDHVALVTLDRGRRVRPGTASRIARRPLGEWHAFADMPSGDAGASRMAVSRGGDWTARFIADRPDSVWVRGVPTAGVVTVARLFHRVVWVATGSGIAPCLPQLLCGSTPARLVWVTRNPERTYGPELVGEILTAQPDTIVYDTDALGQPDLAELAYRVCRETGAEAVICISNRKATLRLVAQLRQRGMTAVGPIWDS
ncbi:hypothetical protein ACU610_07285 [Geodermatophilus sp. URMC 61]|uniref:hypothetical protein n=1 Tax=Geodermatophilus sp. URMC 61 TaxID=3423411 RepID=UPI00406C8107